jgi:hypothetical protein
MQLGNYGYMIYNICSILSTWYEAVDVWLPLVFYIRAVLYFIVCWKVGYPHWGEGEI